MQEENKMKMKIKKKKVIARLKPFPYTKQDLETHLRKPELIKSLSVDINRYNSGSTGEDEQQCDKTSTLFYSTDDHPYNKRNFKYTPCRPNPFFTSKMYSTTDIPPFKVRLSYFDRSTGLHIDESCNKGIAENGWLSSRANVGVREGKWYIEFKILRSDGDGVNNNASTAFSRNSSVLMDNGNTSKSRSNTPESGGVGHHHAGQGHVRIGFARKEASLEAPVGMDGYGYGLRDKTGQLVHLSRPVDFMNEGFGTGDVIGMLIELPSMKVQHRIRDLQIKQQIVGQPEDEEVEKEDDDQDDHTADSGVGIIRDQIPIKYKSQLFFEQYEYKSTNPMEHLLNPVTVFGERAVLDTKKFKPAILPDSKIVIYKNGKLVGTGFEKLYAFLPPSSEQKRPVANKAAEGKFKVDEDDGSLGYYPMISCFKTGSVEINPGPHMEYVPEDLKQRLDQGDVKLYYQRYNERVVEDYLFDLIDEVESRYLDSLE